MTISVEVRDSNVSKSMMQLKRTLIREGLFKELKKRKFYTKPSVAKRNVHISTSWKLIHNLNSFLSSKKVFRIEKN